MARVEAVGKRRTVTATELFEHLGEYLGRVRYGSERIVVTHAMLPPVRMSV